MEAELPAATDAMYAAWQRLKFDTTKDAQLRTAVRYGCKWRKKVRSPAVRAPRR